jgi:hypothetical protein
LTLKRAQRRQKSVAVHRVNRRQSLRKSRTTTSSDPEVRKTAGYFQQKTTELHALNRSIEETRTRLVTQMDRLEELKLQLEFNRTAAQIGEAVKGGEASLDDMQAIAEDARRIAADLDGFGRAPTVLTESAEAAKPVEVAKPAGVQLQPLPSACRYGTKVDSPENGCSRQSRSPMRSGCFSLAFGHTPPVGLLLNA